MGRKLVLPILSTGLVRHTVRPVSGHAKSLDSKDESPMALIAFELIASLVCALLVIENNKKSVV